VDDFDAFCERLDFDRFLTSVCMHECKILI
jgi:hypothetical protein